jgi:hypothetical protein
LFAQPLPQEAVRQPQWSGNAPETAQLTTTEKQQGVPPAPFGLEDGTPVRLRLTRDLSSSKDIAGTRVNFEVIEDVRVRDVVVVPKGATAWGTVTKAHGKRKLGRSGELEVRIEVVLSTDGERVPLRAIQGGRGKSRTGIVEAGVFESALLFWPAAPWFLFIPGKDINIPKGAEVVAYVDGDTPLDPQKFVTASNLPISESTATAAEPGCVSLNRTEANKCPRDWISANVLTREGGIVRGLDAPDFLGAFQHKPVKILSATWDEQPRRVVILLDVSESAISTKRFWELELRAVGQLVAGAPPTTQIGLATFSDSIERTVRFGPDNHRVLNALGELRTSPKTFVKGVREKALWSAIQESLNRFCGLRGGDVLYVISDGKDNASHITTKESEKALVGAGIRLFAFRLVTEEELRMEREADEPQPLQALVDSTGGSSVTQVWDLVPYGSPEELKERLRMANQLPLRLAAQCRLMTSYYKLQVEFPEPMDEPQKWELKVVSPKQFKDSVLLYPELAGRCSGNSPATANPQ